MAARGHVWVLTRRSTMEMGGTLRVHRALVAAGSSLQAEAGVQGVRSPGSSKMRMASLLLPLCTSLEALGLGPVRVLTVSNAATLRSEQIKDLASVMATHVRALPLNCSNITPPVPAASLASSGFLDSIANP